MKFAVLILICTLFGSCFNDGNCIITATNSMHIQFKKLTNTTLDSTILLDTVYVSGTDTFLVVNTAVTEFLFPVDTHSDITTFVLKHTNSAKTIYGSDTLQVGYTAQSKIIAKDCGAFTYYQNLKIIHSNLKEIKAFSPSGENAAAVAPGMNIDVTSEGVPPTLTM